MNFEFLQSLKGLKELYIPCKDAEELVVSKPYLSMTASRKSAEALARFIYLNAYKHASGSLGFAEILTDYTVKKYINSRDVLHALHNIRKNGNSAVHGDDEKTFDQAIDSLANLHYAAGEIAKKERLIDSYPRFTPDVKENTAAELHDFDPVQLAEDMFNENIAKYQAEKLMNQLSYFLSPFRFIHGDIEISECLELKHRPTLSGTIPQIQAYFGYLAMKAIKYQYEEKEHDRKVSFNATLTTYGEQNKTTTNLCEFIEGLMNDLPAAERFEISSQYYGPGFGGMVDDEIHEPFYYACEFDKNEECNNVTYKCFEFLYNHGEGGCMKFENGSWVDLEKQYRQDVLDMDFGSEWWCWNMDLNVEFDFKKYPDIARALQETVRKHVPEDQIEYCEQEWGDCDYDVLINSISWYSRKLRVVQDFLDEINRIIMPIKDECDCWAKGNWHVIDGPKATATWGWFEDGFKVVGTEL